MVHNIMCNQSVSSFMVYIPITSKYMNEFRDISDEPFLEEMVTPRVVQPLDPTVAVPSQNQ